MTNPGRLPNGWQVTTLGEAFSWSSGGTPKSTVLSYYGGGIPWAIIGDLTDGPVHETKSTITEAGLKTSSAKWVEPGSLLLAMYGSIGKLGIATARMTTNQAIAFTKPECCSTRYLFWYLYFVRPELAARGKGGTQSNISQTVIKAFPFLLPPTDVQERIVEEIEKQLTRLEAGVAALKRVRANLKRYRAAVLKAACEGRLVPTEADLARSEGRHYDPASVLLERIKAEKAKVAAPSRRGRQRRDSAATLPPDLSPLPEGWAWATLGEVAAIKGGVTKSQERKPGAGMRLVAYLRVANVQRGFLDLAEVTQIAATEEEIAELALMPGDVLFNEGGDRDKLGRGWVWQGEILECIHQNHVFRARLLGAGLQPKFVSWYGNTAGQAYFAAQGKQTTNLASINLTKLSALPIPLPPVAEQRRIVAEVERRLSLADDLDRIVAANLLRATRLRQSIFTAAFSGRLAAGHQVPSADALPMVAEGKANYRARGRSDG